MLVRAIVIVCTFARILGKLCLYGSSSVLGLLE